MTVGAVNATHDPALRSWVESANLPGADFPVQNLPLGRFRRLRSDEPLRCGVAIGDQVLDLKMAATLCPWPDEVHPLLEPLAAGDLAEFMARGHRAWHLLRGALSAALADGSDQGPFLELCLVPRAQVQMAMPCAIGEYTEFHAGIHHACAVGALTRPDAPLPPNYKWLPLGGAGRASSIGIGGAVRRPNGQHRGPDDTPRWGPSRWLDYELELGALVGTGNPLGHPVPMARAEEQIFGLVLLNDWSARDLQAWEASPLGPFLGKNFASSISPWVVTMEALAPFRRPLARPEGDPDPLPHLDSAFNRERGALAITLEAWLQTASMRLARQPPVRLARASALHAYWSFAQLLTHHTSNGCNLRTGDLLGSGTLSGPGPGEGGTLLELTQAGRRPIALPNGERRRFLEDGDRVVLRAYAEGPGAVRIGFGEVSGTVLPAPDC